MKRKKTPTADLETLIPILVGIFRRLTKEKGPLDALQTREFRRVVASLKKLHQGLFDDKTLLGTDYYSDPSLLQASMLYDWVIHYQQGLSLINELPSPPQRVWDICSGLSPFGFAALKHGAREVISSDRNAQALELGAEIAGRYGFPLSLRPWKIPTPTLPVEGHFDLIILAHCLEELFPEELKVEFIDKLMHRLTPTGHLLLVGSSTVESNQKILKLRDKLVQSGRSILAPCVWQGECPALKVANAPCYAQRELEKPNLIKEFQRAANINLSSLKMTYLIVNSPGATWPALPDDNCYGVISPPVESYQGKRYYLCGTKGKKSLGSHLKTQAPETRAFEYLRRGELISVEKPLETSHTLDIIQGTKLKVVAACGKPIPQGGEDAGD